MKLIFGHIEEFGNFAHGLKICSLYTNNILLNLTRVVLLNKIHS